MNTNLIRPSECQGSAKSFGNHTDYHATPARLKNDYQDEIIEIWAALQAIIERLDALDGGVGERKKS